MKITLINLCLLFSILGSSTTLDAQISTGLKVTPAISLRYTLGSHFNQATLGWSFAISYQRFQLNGGFEGSFASKSLANRKNLLELKSYLGILLLGGKKKNNPDPIVSNLTNNSIFMNAFGYAYLWYIDNKRTSQASGAWALSSGKYSIYFENDVFGGFGEDKYRSAEFVFMYREDFIRLKSQIYIWTGDSRGTFWFRDKPNICPYGYKMLKHQPYGKTSHGIINISLDYYSNQSLQSFSLGLDSENIRHYIQNRVIHDLYWLPKWMPRNTPHYPRLNAQGDPVFEAKLRKKDQIYFQIGHGLMR